MSRPLDIVVQGVLGTHPSVVRTATGKAFCHFRVATTPSFRTETGWRDGPTLWFTAKSWGALAENLGHSLHKGDPVVLVGRLSQESWADERGEHLDSVVTLSCGGHDLTRGESRFMRISRAVAPEAASPQEAASTASADGVPRTGAAPHDAPEPAGTSAGSPTAGRAGESGESQEPGEPVRARDGGADAPAGHGGLSDSHWLVPEPDPAVVPAAADELDYVLAEPVPS